MDYGDNLGLVVLKLDSNWFVFRGDHLAIWSLNVCF